MNDEMVTYMFMKTYVKGNWELTFINLVTGLLAVNNVLISQLYNLSFFTNFW